MERLPVSKVHAHCREAEGDGRSGVDNGDYDKDKDEDDQHVMRMRNDDRDAGGPATAASPRGDRGKTAGSGAPQAWRQVVIAMLSIIATGSVK